VGVDFRDGNSQQFFAAAKALHLKKHSYIYLLFEFKSIKTNW
jgi:hypothetical protein